MSRRKQAKSHVNHERWLVSYADFITLLFAFFVVLYASSQVDTKKAARVGVAIQGGFSEMGVFASGPPQAPLRVEAATIVTDSSQPNFPELGHLVNDMPGSRSLSQREVPVSVVKRQLEKAFQEEIRKSQDRKSVV
jgi:chemotaxis protein MotB